MAHPKPHIRFKGVWDMQDLYEFLISYFRDRKYKFHEKIYKHKAPSPFGVERQYIWHAERMIDEMHHFHIDIYIHTYDAHDIEVRLPNGNMKIYTKGRIWIEFGSYIDMYFDDEHSHEGSSRRWSSNRTLASMRMFLNNFVVRKKHGWHTWDVMMYREVQKAVWLTRRRLKMEYDEYEMKNWMGVHN